MKKILLNLLYPKRCLGCKSFGSYICSSCVKTIIPYSNQICLECTRPAIDGVTHPSCRSRQASDGLTVVYPYRGVLRNTLKKLKYSPWLTDLKWTITTLTVSGLCDKRAFKRFCAKKPIVTAVPLHWRRMLFRGYNHADMLAKMFAQARGLLFYSGLLNRYRHTKPQYGLDRKERISNVAKAFKTTKYLQKLLESNRKQSIVLFDDVLTTGSTMRACVNVLKKAGVDEVWAMSISR